jgi:hypothetical protein
MSVDVDQETEIHRLTAEFIADLEGRGFHRPQIARVMTALGVNLASSCNDPAALALVIEAALHEMNPHRKLASGGRSHPSEAATGGLRPARLEPNESGGP